MPARQHQRSAVPRAKLRIAGAPARLCLVVLHDGNPVAAVRRGQRAPRAGAHRRVAGTGGVSLPVPCDRLLEPSHLHQEVGHANKGQDAPGVRPCRLFVRRLGLCAPAEARKAVAPVQQGPQVAPRALGLVQVPVAYLEGPCGRLDRAAGNAGRIHYRRLDDEGRGQVLVAARQDGVHEPLCHAEVPHVVKPERAERVDQLVAQVEQAGKVVAHLLQALPQGGKAILVGQHLDRLDALEPLRQRINAGHAHPDGAGNALDLRRRVRPPAQRVEPLLEDQPQELLDYGDGLHDDRRLYDGVARPCAHLQLR